SAHPGAHGPLLGPGPLPGAAAAGLPGELPDGEAVRPPVADGAPADRRDPDSLRDAARGAEPDRLGDGHRALSPAAPGRPPLRAHPGLQPPELLPGLPQRDPGAVPRRPRASLRALRRPHPRASLRPSPDGVPGHGGRAHYLEPDLPSLRRVLGLRAAAL